jgi:hypothetical protein
MLLNGDALLTNRTCGDCIRLQIGSKLAKGSKLSLRRNEEGHRVDEQRVAVRRGTRHDVGADRGAGAGPVLDDESRAVGAVDLLGDETRDDVGRSSRRIGIDELDSARLRQGALRRDCERDDGGETNQRGTGGDTPHIPNEHCGILP